jgi:hypothetical protein
MAVLVLIGILHATANDERIAGNHQHRRKYNEVFHFDLLSVPYISTCATKPLAAFCLSLCEFCPVKNHARLGSSAGNLFAKECLAVIQRAESTPRL